MQQPTDMLSVLTALPLFAGCPPDVLAKVLLPDCRMATYEAGESIRQYDDPPVLCILTAGSASVHTPGEGSECLLRVLHAGDVFGVATLFAASPAVTRVTAEQPTRVLIVSEAAVRALLTGTPAFALNYVAFLSDRIRFLNRRLACLGAGSAARRLAAWLDASIPDGAAEYELPLSLSRLPDALGVSRASLYRALDELEAAGHIARSGRHISLPDRERMCRAFGLS